MKRFLIVFIVALLIPISCYSEESYDTYKESYDLSFFENELDKDTYSVLEQLGIENFDYKNISSLSLKDIFKAFKSILNGSVESPLQSSLIVIVFVILSSFFQSFKENDNSLSEVYSTASALIISIVLFVKIGDTISLSSFSIETAANFVYAFIPIFFTIVASSGGISTAFATNSMLLTLSQMLSFLSSSLFMPIINCFLAIGVCASLRHQLGMNRLVETIKKMITTIISFLSACFVSILSIKTAVASKADAIGLRSIRFAINSVVPVIGSAISEGLLSIQTYSSLLKNTVGVVGIIAISFVFIPSIFKVVIWRFMLSICRLISDVFGDESVSLTLKTFNETMLLINVVLILSMVTTIISFGILIASRNA